MSIVTTEMGDGTARLRLYRSIWRWHFYAGLVVVPFLSILAITGLVMLYASPAEGLVGTTNEGSADAAQHRSLEAQAQAAVSTVSNGRLSTLIHPADNAGASRFLVDADGRTLVVGIDPESAEATAAIAQDDTFYYLAKDIHGSLLLGTFGDRLLEIVAGLGIVLVITGLYLWWPRNGRSIGRALVPDVAQRGRGLLKELHVSIGFYISIVLLFFLLSGLAWTDIWGGRMVQAWSTFPAEKWNAPPSDLTHESMNHGAMKEVPWALEQTPLPRSGEPDAHAGHGSGTGHGAHAEHGAAGDAGPQAVGLDRVAALARQIGFDGQFRIDLPKDATGVYTISADSMSGDTTNATGDRTVHVDQYSGEVLAEVGFADYGVGGKAMAVGIALHQATLGPVNLALNTLFCVAVLLMSGTGIIMWWKRRPTGSFGAPRYPKNFRAPWVILMVALAVCVMFPLTGLAVLLFAAIDFFLPRRLKEAGAQSAGA